MRLSIAAATGVATLLLSVPVQSNTQTQQEEEASTVSSTTRVICRREPAPTGSRVGGRNFCNTERQWALIEEESYNSLKNAGNRNRFGNEGGGGNCGSFDRRC